jgi:sulfur-oxidizing protein SoxX
MSRKRNPQRYCAVVKTGCAMTNLSSQIFTCLTIITCLTLSFAVGAEQKPQTALANGKAIAEALCQACHAFKGADQAGTVAPPFVVMKQRFPERDKLRAIIYDAQKALNPYTMMPPFGRHGLVDETQTEQLIDFLYSL